MNQFTIPITGGASEMLSRIKDVPGAMRACARVMDQENQFTVSRIQQFYLSFPKDGPTQSVGCRVISNRLRSSIRAAKAVPTPDSVLSAIGSNVKYAAILEFGGQTKPHVIKAKNGGALKFIMGGQTFLRKQVNHPGSTFQPRRFVQRGIEERLDTYGQEFSAAIVKFLEGEQ